MHISVVLTHVASLFANYDQDGALHKMRGKN